jgi:hypothetical protein
LSNRAEIEAVLNQFLDALNSDDVSQLPLDEHAMFSGVLSPEPIQGEASVREHLLQIAPFMLNIHSTKVVIEDGAVAALTRFSGVNDVHVWGTMFLDINDGKITSIRSVFDSRPFFAGHN